MTREELLEKLECMGLDKDTVALFENPSFEGAILGVTEEGNVCYSYSKMVESMVDEDTTMEDAIEFISYNTIRSLEYFRGQKDMTWPIIVYDDDF